MEQRGAAALATEFERVSRVIAAGGDVPTVLGRVVTVAQQVVGGCDWAAATRGGRRPRTEAVTDATARRVDDLQIEAGEGPAIEGATHTGVVHVPDLAAETRWPRFRHEALESTPVRSVLTFRVDRSEPGTTLSLYAGRPRAFVGDDLTTAAVLATHTQVAMAHLGAALKVANLEHALTTSRLIGEAVGVLMALHRVTSDDAFEMLRRTSQNLNRKLHDVATEVAETGILPQPTDTGPSHHPRGSG